MKFKHIHTKKIMLYLLNELPPGNREKVENHCAACEPCRKRLEEEKRLLKVVQRQPSWVPQENVLQKLRIRLIKRVKSINKPRISEGFLEKLPVFLRSGWTFQLQWAAFVLFFCLGLAAGRIISSHKFKQPSTVAETLQSLTSSQQLSDFKIMAVNNKNDQLEIRFRAVQEQVIRGGIEDPAIQYILSYALMHSPGDNIRLRIVDLLGRSRSEHPDVQEALIHALENDLNPGIRLKAIRLLIRLFPVSDFLKTVLMRVFIQDPNEGIRIEAANTLNRLYDPNVMPLLKKEASGNEYVRSLLMK